LTKEEKTVLNYSKTSSQERIPDTKRSDMPIAMQ